MWNNLRTVEDSRCYKDSLNEQIKLLFNVGWDSYFQLEKEVGLYNVDRKSMASLAMLLMAFLQGSASRAAS